jgi:hypothetical protein
MMSGNTRLERLGSWLAWRIGGYGSPSLYAMGLRPTLQWVLSGRSLDAGPIEAGHDRS